jgi:hypothetical protein
MDVGVLAHSVTMFLLPVLPYLSKPGEKVVEEIGKKIGGEVWEGAKALWAKLFPKIEAKPALLDAVQHAALPSASEDARLLETAQPVGVHVAVSGHRSVGIGGSVSGSTIITGDRNR